MDYSNKHITSEILRQINADVALMKQEYSFNASGPLKDEIFELLEKVGTLIFYPFEKENLWGIYVSKNEKHYFIINSSIAFEKQIFAGAHELAHSLDIAKVKFEISMILKFNRLNKRGKRVNTQKINLRQASL